jgi:hypothetical protein
MYKKVVYDIRREGEHMSRGYGRLERQILAVLEADGGAHVWVRLETLVYAVSGCISRLGEDYDPHEAIRPVCHCKPYYIPALGQFPCYDHTEACYPHPRPPSRAEIAAIQRAVRSLARKGILKSVRVGWLLATWWGSRYPGRIACVWRAETPIEALPQDIRIAWWVQHGYPEISVACSNRQHLEV